MQGTANKHIKRLVGIEANDHAVGTVIGPVIDTLGFDEFQAHIAVNDKGVAGTVDAKLQEGDESNGSDMADISGAAAAQIIASAKRALISLYLQNRKRFVRVVSVVGTNSVKHYADVSLSEAKDRSVSQDADESVDVR